MCVNERTNANGEAVNETRQTAWHLKSPNLFQYGTTNKYPLSFSLPQITFSIVLVFVTANGIDEFMSCDRYIESKREARILDNIPCDMSTKSYCEHKGSAYPEAAIWRFKEENRALMRRLYGDMESNSVYREMRAANLHNLPSEEHSIFSSLEYNIRMGSGLATVKSAREPVVGDTKKRKVIVKKKRKTTSKPVATQAHFKPPVDSQPTAEEQQYRKKLFTITILKSSCATNYDITSILCPKLLQLPLLRGLRLQRRQPIVG